MYCSTGTDLIMVVCCDLIVVVCCACCLPSLCSQALSALLSVPQSRLCSGPGCHVAPQAHHPLGVWHCHWTAFLFYLLCQDGVYQSEDPVGPHHPFSLYPLSEHQYWVMTASMYLLGSLILTSLFHHCRATGARVLSIFFLWCPPASAVPIVCGTDRGAAIVYKQCHHCHRVPFPRHSELSWGLRICYLFFTLQMVTKQLFDF